LVRYLTVGINYIGTPYELEGCINDTDNLISQLKTYFPSCTNYHQLTDKTPMKPTKANIMACLNWLIMNLKSGQNVLFHYSGHGGILTNVAGNRVDGYDCCIYACNNGTIEVIEAKELHAALSAKLPAGSKCFIIVDSCHSATTMELPYQWTERNNVVTYKENPEIPVEQGNIVFLAACQDNEKDSRPCGALTTALLNVWKSYGPSIKLYRLLSDVSNFMAANGYTQHPALSTSRLLDMTEDWNLGLP